MLRSILTITLMVSSPAIAQSVSCQAQPESPQCSKGDACVGNDAVEGGNNMAFSLEGSKLSICEAVMCMDGKVTARKNAGSVRFVSGLVRKINPETNKPEGLSLSVSAMIDANSSLAHIAWDKRGIMMKCE